MAITELNEVHKASWTERMSGSFRGIVTGFGLIVAAVCLLWWNEGRAVKTAKALGEGAGAVVSVPSDKVDPANEGKLVHVTGKADTKDVLADPQFGISATAIRLVRSVEIFQWVQYTDTRRIKKDGKEYDETTYTYKQEWCRKPVDSSAFKDSSKVNPATTLPFDDETKYASNVTLGAFRLSETDVRRIGGEKPFKFADDYKTPEALTGAQLQNGFIYLPVAAPSAASAVATVVNAAVSSGNGGSPLAGGAAKPTGSPLAGATGNSGSPLAGASAKPAGSPLASAATAVAATVSNVANAVVGGMRSVAGQPMIGDVRVKFEVVEPHDISIVARQKGDSFTAWTAKNGKSLSFLRNGVVDAAEIFADAESGNKTMTWILRLVGFLLMLSGFKGVFGPISTLVDVVPILSSIVSFGVGLVSFLLAAALSLLVIGIAWIVYRPVLGIALLVGAGALVVLVLTRKKAAPAPATK